MAAAPGSGKESTPPGLRIDRPLLPERPPSGRQVSGTRGQAGLGRHAGVCGGRTLGRVSGRRPSAGHQHGHVVVPAVATADMATHAARSRTRARTRCSRRPRPRPSEVSMVGVRSPWSPRRPRGLQERTCRGLCRTLALRPSGLPSRFRTPADTCRLRCHPAGAVATGTGRRAGGRWWYAASAGGREQAARSAGRGAGRGRRSSPGG
jgi:hypothetical protein